MRRPPPFDSEPLLVQRREERWLRRYCRFAARETGWGDLLRFLSKQQLLISDPRHASDAPWKVTGAWVNTGLLCEGTDGLMRNERCTLAGGQSTTATQGNGVRAVRCRYSYIM